MTSVTPPSSTISIPAYARWPTKLMTYTTQSMTRTTRWRISTQSCSSSRDQECGPESYSLARQAIPLKPEVFHGRDDLVEGVAQLLLREETSRVCILGPGGMGKTSVTMSVSTIFAADLWEMDTNILNIMGPV